MDRRTPPGPHYIAKSLANINNNEDVAHFYNRAIEIGVSASTAAEIFSPGRRSGETFQTAAGPAAVYPGTIPYSYYHAQYNAGPSTTQYANHNFDATHEENGSGLSPSRQAQTYYSQGGSQGQVTPSTGLQTSAANAQLQPMIHPSIAQPMGQFQYPQTALPYGQYPATSYYHYPAHQTGSGAPLFQYVYPQTDNQTQSGTMLAGAAAEESESR